MTEITRGEIEIFNVLASLPKSAKSEAEPFFRSRVPLSTTPSRYIACKRLRAATPDRSANSRTTRFGGSVTRRFGTAASFQRRGLS